MIHQILKDLGFDHLLEDEHKMLLSYASKLMSRLAQGEFGEPPADDDSLVILDEFQTESVPSDEDLIQILNRIKHSKDLDKSLTPAMLASMPHIPFFDYMHYERVKAWALLAIIGLSIEGGHETVINEGARRIRLMLLPKYHWMLNKFPAFNQDLYETVRQLEELREEYRDDIENKDSRVGNVHLLLSDYVTQRLPKEYVDDTNSDNGNRRPLKPIEISPTPELQDPDYEYIELVERPKRDIVSIAEAELESDQALASKYIQTDKLLRHSNDLSLGMRANHARTMANRLTMRQMHLPCDWGALTHHEANLILKECWQSAIRGETANLIPILMLLTGRSAQRIIDLFTPRKDTGGDEFTLKNHHVALAYSLQLPIHHIDKSAHKLIFKNVRDTFYLVLPDELYLSVYNHKEDLLIISSDLLVRVRDRIAQINRKHHSHITPARISGYLYTLIKKISDDPADAALICGHSPQQCPALFYYHPFVDSLTNIYQEVRKQITESSGIRTTYPNTKNQHFPIGSRLNIDAELVKRLFIEQAKRIKYLRDSFHYDPFEFHNEYVAYTYQFLTLGTAHRPVMAPFELRSDIDLIRKTIWISDKEVRSGLAARTLILPEQVCKQILHYDNHLLDLQGEYKLTMPRLSDKLNDSLNSKTYYLQWFKNKQLVPLRPKFLVEFMADRWPLPLNWPRHFMRNALKQEGISGELINAWLGHADFGEEAFGPYSGLSVKSFQIVAQAIEKILTRLEIPIISGWEKRF